MYSGDVFVTFVLLNICKYHHIDGMTLGLTLFLTFSNMPCCIIIISQGTLFIAILLTQDAAYICFRICLKFQILFGCRGAVVDD